MRRNLIHIDDEASETQKLEKLINSLNCPYKVLRPQCLDNLEATDDVFELINSIVEFVMKVATPDFESVVLLDVLFELPTKSVPIRLGYDIGEKLRSERPDLPIILLTVDEDDTGALEQFNYDEYLTKSELYNMTRRDQFETVIGRGRRRRKNLLQEAELSRCDYAIVTALEQDEMAKFVSQLVRVGRDTSGHLIEWGYFRNCPDKRIVWASQYEIGAVDAAILATDLISRFRPSFLILAGVLAGNPRKASVGDIVVATSVNRIHVGKLSDVGFEPEERRQSVENAGVANLMRRSKEIARLIEDSEPSRSGPVNVHFGPITCVEQVIDYPDFFEKVLEPKDRKLVALEMESWGTLRATQILNRKQTWPIIVKAVMDNAQDKDDDNKAFAAWRSAQFVRLAIENDVI